jgi:hypothetical protein
MLAATRWNISPSAMPPKLVMKKSLSDGRYDSPRYSHVHDPRNASGADSQ